MEHQIIRVFLFFHPASFILYYSVASDNAKAEFDVNRHLLWDQDHPKYRLLSCLELFIFRHECAFGQAHAIPNVEILYGCT